MNDRRRARLQQAGVEQNSAYAHLKEGCCGKPRRPSLFWKLKVESEKVKVRGGLSF
jgi:hypothetical protein